ncbi:MAG: zinc-dependent alcohol dehydrogenase family protein [Legionella longbeachae]|nr:zinc-dependent alcohol dehydrogenase family protein [Legionella longbeachae]
MRSMIINQFGGFNVFEEANIAKPSLKKGHVLIKVEATSVNPLDIKLRNGDKPGLIPSFPMVLHGDVAGTVIEVDESVSQFKVGDEVYGCAGGLLDMQGALAEYMLADVDLIAHKPKSLSFVQAAALPLVSLTAWEGLVTRARVQKNQRVLIHGATGGVGHLAIQLAKHLGAVVSATASTPEKCEIAKQLGAEHAINYKTTLVEDYTAGLTQGGFDVVFDTVGGEHLQKSIKATAINGQIITILSAGRLDTDPVFSKGLSIHFILQPLPLITGINRKHYGEILTNIAKLADAAIIKPLLDPHQLSISDVATAHELLENNQAIGKVVMRGI